MLLLALANVATLTVAVRPADKSAAPSFGEEGHTRVFSMASAPTGMVPHYIGFIAYMPPDAAANITWHDQETGANISDLGARSKRRTACSTPECSTGVYICSTENYEGSCYWQQAGGGACHPYPYTRASSFGIDMNIQCALFQSLGCLWNQYTALTWPDLSSLYGEYRWWNSRPSSYKCRPCVGCIYNKAPAWTINTSSD